VNSEHLSHIVKQPESITGQDALELEELCRKFPSFPIPFILLSTYYHQKGDYRAEETIQKAALRVWDRAWLADFVQNKKSEPSIEPKVPYVEEVIITETVETTEVLTADDDVSEPITEAVPNPELIPSEKENPTESEVNTVFSFEQNNIEVKPNESADTVNFKVEVTETTDDRKPKEEPETELNSVSSLFIPEDPEEWVFDEIETLETGNAASILGFAEINKTENSENTAFVLPEITAGAGGMIQPDVETEKAVEENISESENDETTSITLVAPYRIEQYYPGIRTEKLDIPTDFYSWLSNPAPGDNEVDSSKNESEEAITSRLQQQNIIDRFIQSDPGVIRPKKEFFTPEIAAKKSEHLPENMATETLAKVYLQQGNTEGAIRIYERLMLKFPKKNTYFAGLIKKIKNENNP